MPIAVLAQGVRYDLPPILGQNGLPLHNVGVTLCPGTATITGTTCSPTTQSFTDITLGTQCASGLPVTLPASNVCKATSDAFGNAGFWLSPGAYIYCLNGPGISGTCYNLTAYAGGSTLNVTTSLAGCYAALPSTGGTCVVPPNYAETLSANLVLSKNNAGFVFTGPAAITMGSFQVTKAGTVSGAFIIGQNYSPFFTTDSARFIYTGNGTAFSLGDFTNTTIGLELDNFVIDLSGAGTSAVGLNVIGATPLLSKGVSIQGLLAANSQVLMVLDGGNVSSTTEGDWSGLYLRGGNTCLRLTGTGGGASAANANRMTGICTAATTKGLDFVSGNGNFIVMDIENIPTTVSMSNATTNSNNQIAIYNCGETTFANIAGANAANNAIVALGGCSIVGKVTDSGTGNSIYNLSQPFQMTTTQLKGLNGTLAAPTYSFTNSPGTGFYRQGADVVGLSTAGVDNALFTTGIWRFNSTDVFSVAAGAPSVGAGDTAWSRCSAGVLCVGVNETVGNTGGELRSAKISATYNAAGTLQTAVHLVQDTCTLGTNCGVTLSGSAAFTNATSYTCTCHDQTTPLNACGVNQTGGAGLTITGTGTDVIRYQCLGN